jgi:hypothetical protein
MGKCRPNPWLYERRPDRAAAPNCGDCHSRGFDYELGYARTCRCRYSYDIDQWWREIQASHGVRQPT